MASNLSNIRDEDLLRRMWQETEDFGRKKEIRQHMYKLRESRLKDFYTNEMDTKNTFNPKAPITSRHGDAMADHSFESFKSQEIRDSKSPTRDLKFGMSGNTGGWNVISSSEVSGDGKNRTDQMLATTEGVSAVKGGTKAFVGKNEEMKTEKYDGDDKNFTYSTGESSNMVLNENIVTGDDRNRRTENKSSSVSHSTNIVKSSTNSGINDNDMQQQLMEDNVSRQSSTNTNKSSSTSNNRTTNQNSSTVSSNNDNNSNFNTNTTNAMSAADQQRLNQQLKNESGQVQEAFRLAQQPGNVISHTVERANPTTNMITEKKELADGTIVTTKRYETIASDNVDNQTSRNVSTDNNTRSNINKNNTSQSQNYENTSQTTKNVNQTTKISRDEEAFRQAEKEGTVLSRNVEMSDPTTRMITEKKQLADGTVVTTKKYEKITSENTQSRNSNTNRNSNTFDSTDNQNTSRDTNTSTNDNYNTENVKKTSNNVNQTFKSARDEEAFRLADKQGTVLSRNVEMSDPTTRMITEKKQLADGTIVTTKKFEKITSENTQSRNSNTNRNSNTFENTETSRDTNTSTNNKFDAENVKKTINNVNQTFKSTRDEEAFRLAEKQGTVISRNVEMADPTTRMITEKKQLADGTVVTTKKYEKITSDNENQSNRNINQNQKSTNENSKTEIVHNVNIVRENSNSLDSQTNQNQTNKQTKDNQKTTIHNVTETFKTARDEEAFRLAQQPGNVISRQVELANPTTRMITEKKELTDGTIVTTKRYETITSDNVNTQSTRNDNRDNVESQNVRKTVQNTNQSTNINKTNTQRNENVVDDNTRREIVEETVTKKLFDTSCHCPEMDHKNHSRNTKEFINKERDDHTTYDVNIDIITTDDRKVKQNNNTFADNEKRNEVRRSDNNYSEPTRREEPVRKENRPDYINKKISVELDASHKAFASSLRCVTPPNGRISTPSSSRNEIRSQRSPSRETTSSKISSATTTLRKNSGDFMRPTKSSDRRSSVKESVEKQPKKVYKDTLEKTTVVDTDSSVVNKKTTTRDGKPQPAEVPRNSRDKSPKDSYPGTDDSRDKSPQKVQPSVKPRESSPQKSSPPGFERISSRDKPAGISSRPRDDSPDKKYPSRENSSPRDMSPQKSRPAGISSRPRDDSPDTKYPSRENSSPRDKSPQKSHPSRESSSPRDDVSSSPRDKSPQKNQPSAKSTEPRDRSPQKSHPDSGVVTKTAGIPSRPRDNSPKKAYPGSETPSSRDKSPMKNQPSAKSTEPRDRSPQKSHPDVGVATKTAGIPSRPRDNSPKKAYPGSETPSSRDKSPQKMQPSVMPSKSRDGSPQKSSDKPAGKTSPRDNSPQKSIPSRENSSPRDHPVETSTSPRDKSPLKSQTAKIPSARDSSPQKGTTGIFRNPNDSGSQKYQPTTELSYPCDKSPEPSHFGKSGPIEKLQPKYSPATDSPSVRDKSPQKAFPGLEPISSKDRTYPKHNDDFERKPSQHSGQSTPRDRSPNKPYSDSGSSTPRGMSPLKSFPEFERTTPTNQSPQKSQPGSRGNSPKYCSNEKPSQPESGNSTPRDRSPQKTYEKPAQPESGNSTPRDRSPQKTYGKPAQPESGNSTPRDRSPQKTYGKPAHPESGNSTPRDRSPQKPNQDYTRKTPQTDKRISPTTSVSDLEYFTSDPRLVTDLDYEDNEESHVDYESQTDTYERTSTTTDRRVLNKKNPQHEKPSDVKGSTKKPTEKAPFNRNRSETFEERASKLIGKQTETTDQYDRVVKKVPKPSSPTKSTPDTNTPTNRVSEIRERKAKIEKETANIEKMTVNKKKSITSSSNDFITRERMEQRIPKDKVTSSPDQSPERGFTRNTNEIKQTNNRTTVNDDVTQSKMTTNTIKTSKVTREPSTKQTDVPSYLMPTETARRRMTSEDEQTLRKSPVKSQSRPETSEPKNHISVAKINISPIRGSVRSTIKSTYDKTINETSKTLKVAPSIMLVKRPLTDVSSTEPDSDQEYDHELLQNVDKLTTKSIRKKLIQNRKDSAPVSRTTEKEKISRSTSENMFKSDTSTLKRRTSKDTPTKESSPKKDMKRPVKCVTTKTINLTAVNDNKSFNSNTLDDVIIHVQQAKSSREPSPNKSVPIPVRPDEIINEKQTIYPDSVTEPDDDRKFKPKQRVTNIPIFEEKTNQYVGLEITEVETNINELLEEDEDEEIDEETERSIINSFSLEKADRKRNSIQIDALDDEDTLDETEEEEIRQMSVSAKVNKFMNTAEQVKKPKSSAPFKPDEINIEDISEPEDESQLSVNQKRNKFAKPSDKTSTSKPKEVYRKPVSRTRDEVDESLIEDECLLSVSDKVSKFISTAEKLASSTPQRSPELVKNIMRQTSRPQYEDDLQDNVQDFTRNKETVSTLTKDDRSDSRSTLRSETSQITLKSTEAIKRAREIFESNSTANRDIARHSDIMSRPSVFEAKRTPNAERKVYKDTTPNSRNLQERRSSRDRQSHSPLKETSAPMISKVPVERGPATRGEPKEHFSVKKDLSSPKTSTPARIVEDRRYSRDRQSQSPNHGPETPVLSRKVPADRTPGYLKDQVSSKKDLFEKKISSSRIETSDSMSYNPKSISPQTSVDEDRMGETHYTSRKTSQTSDKPSYMCHTVASREHINAERSESETRETRTTRRDSETRRESVSRLSNPKYDRNVSESTNDSQMHQFDETSKAPKSPTKFGVELKRTDSSRNNQTTTTSTRKISASGDTFDVEEIFDLVELERLLESVVGYEQRRCIRAQIRVVKKMIADKKMSTSSTTSRNERVSSTNYSKSSSSPTRKSRDEPLSTQSKVPQSRVTAEKPVHERITRDDSRLSSKASEMTTRYTTDRATTDSRMSQNKNVSSRTTDKNTPTTPRGIIESFNKNNKGKVESAVKTTKKTTTSSSTSSFSSHSKMRESSEQAKETDCITSSYGVGPTDSNGLPLFGLRALKKKNPSVTTESKMSGSMVSEVSYSENGQPAKVERKTMQYSTDPTDFDQEIDMDSKTSTSERKSSRGGVYSVTKTDRYQDDSKKKSVTAPSAKIIRRGSVKELKDKFIRKDSSSRVTESSTSTSQNKRTSVDYDDYSGSDGETYSVCKETKTSSSSKSFLNSNSKASNVQEVLTYMRNADNVHEDGDTKDDVEARALLNKFLGATALMSGIESKSGLTKEYLSGGGSSSRNQNVSSSSKVTTKTVKSSSANRKSCDIEEIWDSDTLKQLLDSTTNYDERRKIRARLRQIMADKEVCAEIVKNLTAELDANSITNSNHIEGGESLLLPLIQGILQNPKYLPAHQLLNLSLSKNANYASTASRGGRMSSELSNHLNGRLGNDANNYLPIVEDSGTESGEDLRLLAAGLQNNLKRMENEQQLASGDHTSSNPLLKGNNDALGTGLLMEVTTALERLQNSLNLGEIDLEESKKVALLNLVARLQRGLISPEKIVESNADTDSAISNPAASPVEGLHMEDHQGRRGSSGANRFAKRRNREKRHTVGVSREELADARRIIEELELISTMPTTKPKITATVVNSTPGVYNAILTRQFSEPITLLRPSQFVPKEANQHIEIAGKSKYRVLLKQSVSLDQPASILKNTIIRHEPIIIKKMDQFPVEEKLHPPVEFKSKKFTSSVLQRTLSNTNNKFGNTIKNNDNGDDSDGESSSSDDDGGEMTNTKFYQSNKFKAKDNYLRNQQQQENVNAFNYSSGDETSGGFNRPSKYTSKKMKMKRANTVDLPKSYSFVNTFDLSDKECSDNETMRNTYQNRATGLKTTITGGTGFGSTMHIAPKFTPKTENDHKFLAFIQKQNHNVTPSWINPSAEKQGGKTQNWTNKFGNLKNRFEGDEPKEVLKPQHKETSSSAANFWKTVEKEKPSAKVMPLPPIPNPVKMPTSTEKFPWKSSQEKLIRLEDTIQKKKPLMDKFEPKAQPQLEKPRLIPEPNKLPVSKPIMVNQFSHAPMSAFKPPISKKLMSSFKPIQPMEESIKKPMPTMSNGMVKQMAETGYSMNNQVIQPRKKINSPTRMIADSSYIKIKKPVKVEEAPQPTPWAGRAKSDRVMSIATSKFEQNQPTVTFSQQLPQMEPTVKLRNNPLYSGTFEKRSSLPPNASYASFDPITFDSKPKINHEQTQKPLSFQRVCFSPPPPVVKPAKKDYTFVITDFTQPTSVSTYIPHDDKLSRRDSLTNPAEEPIVLTCNRTMISPGDKPKPLELYEISTTPTPLSSQISNDHSTISNDTSFCEELDNEMKDLDSVEHRAVSRVMKAPVISTAYTQSSELHSLNDSPKENSMVKNLQDSLKKFSLKSPTPQDNTMNKFSPKSPTPPEKRVLDTKRLSQDSTGSSNEYKLTSLKFPTKIDFDKRPKEFAQQLSQDSSNSSIDFLPTIKVPFPAQPETSYSFTYASPPKIQVKSPSIDPPAHIIFNNTNNRASYNPVPAHIHAQQHSHMLQKAKSTHMLALPKPSDPPKPQIVMTEKQKKVSSYFTGNKIEAPVAKPSFNAASYVKPATIINTPVSSTQSSSITRKSSLYTKTASKPAQRQNSMGSLSRSRTMPSLANFELLDESNIDDAFEELLSSTNI